MEKLKYLEQGVRPVFALEELLDVCKVLESKYTAYLENERFFAECGATDDQVQIRVTLATKDHGQVYPIEAVLIREPDDKRSLQEQATVLFDYLDIYFEEYLTNGRSTFVTLDWSEHTSEEARFYVRGFVRSLELEVQADQLLSEYGHGDYTIESISSEL